MSDALLAGTLLMLSCLFTAGALCGFILSRRHPDPPQWRIRDGESQADIARRILALRRLR